MAKTENTRVAVDSCTIISRLINDRPDHQDGIESLFHEVDQGKVDLLGSTVLYSEVLGGGFDDPPDPAMENSILAFLGNPKIITLANVTRQVGLIARALRTEHRLRSADSLHLATAVFMAADKFMTMDDRFPLGTTVRGVQVCYPGSALGTPVIPPA